MQAHVRLLLALQREFVTLALARSEAYVITHLLRSACDPLGYHRAIYFSVDRERGIEGRARIEAGRAVEACAVIPNLGANGPFLAALRGESHCGEATSQHAPPLDDARGTYVLSPLRDGKKTIGILYADGFGGRPFEAGASLVAALTAVAAAAIENCAQLARVTDLAMVEPLTGLWNRRALAERLALELERCRRQASSLTYATVDVDDLKAINDSRGHAQGDATLVAVARSLVRSSRTGDAVGRLSGDEFAVILPGADRHLARGLVARLSDALAAAGLRCSVGAAVYPSDADDAAGLALCADRALYAAKAAGKNRYAFA